MDPDATLRDLLVAMEGGDDEQVSILVDALQHWIQHGGFPPRTIGPWRLGQDWHDAIALCVCGTGQGSCSLHG